LGLLIAVTRELNARPDDVRVCGLDALTSRCPSSPLAVTMPGRRAAGRKPAGKGHDRRAGSSTAETAVAPLGVAHPRTCHGSPARAGSAARLACGGAPAIISRVQEAWQEAVGGGGWRWRASASAR